MTQTQPPLTRLRFKNWRSLKDVPIELDTPITVFIGANSSGKTNIVDGLRFLQSANRIGIVESVLRWRGFGKIHTLGVGPGDDAYTRLEFTLRPSETGQPLTYSLDMDFDKDNVSGEYWSYEQMKIGDQTPLNNRVTSGDVNRGLLVRAVHSFEERTGERVNKQQNEAVQQLLQFIEMWQIIDEDFMPLMSLPEAFSGEFYHLDSGGQNLPYVLDFMRQLRPKAFDSLQTDVGFILDHMDSLMTQRNDRETRLIIREKAHRDNEAPSISGGTRRIVGMLTPFYLLDFFLDRPGLVVIEEPDTALNPGLLERFVEQLRYYVSGEHPRQILLTTHNPAFLDYFKPEEVRVVKRDEQGYTRVERIPPYVEDIWLKNGEYGLGQAWMSNAFGGVAE